MGKHKKKKKHKPAANPEKKITIEEQITELTTAITEKRVRKAFNLAKILEKNQALTEEQKRIVIQGYELRISVMMEKKLVKEALEIYNNLIKRNGHYKDYFSTNFLITKDLLQHTTDFLVFYTVDPAKTAIIDQYIRTELKNPQFLADYDHFSGKQAIKEEASLVMAAWEEVESDKHNRDKFQEMLRVIGRRSPLVNWRLFIQGLDAFYENNDTEATAAFNRISQDSILKKITGELENIMAAGESSSRDGKFLLKQINDDSIYDKLSEMDALFADKKYRILENKLLDLCQQLREESKYGLFYEIMALYLQKISVIDFEPSHKLIKFAHDPLVLVKVFYREHDDDESLWEEILSAHKRSLKPIEKALIYNQQASSIIHSMEMGNPFAKMFRFFQRQAREEQKQLLIEASDYWEKSIKIFPLQETYQHWYRNAVSILNKQKAEAVLEDWHSHFPDDIEPLVQLTNSCRNRRVYKKAIKYFEKLDQVGRGNPLVEAIRSYLYIDDAINYLVKNQPEKAAKQLTYVKRDQDPFITTLALTLEWIINPEKEAAGLSALKQPLSVYYILAVLSKEKKIAVPEIPESIQKQAKDADIYVSNFRTLVQLRDPVWNTREIGSYLPGAADYFHRTKLPTTQLRQCLEYFASRLEACDEFSQWEEFLQITANGLMRNDENTAVFLAYRGLVLLNYLDENNRILKPGSINKLLEKTIECFVAAHSLAVKANNLNDLALIKEFTREKNFSDEIAVRSSEIKEYRVKAIVKDESAIHSVDSLKKSLKLKNRNLKKPVSMSTKKSKYAINPDLYNFDELDVDMDSELVDLFDVISRKKNK